MKNYKKLIIPILFFGLLNSSNVFASSINHFNIELEPNEANIGEAIDLTIQAVDKNNVIVTDYEGMIIIFSESDPEAELPSAFQDNTYEFSLSDQGEIKFENGVIFKNHGLQDLYIYDLYDDTIMGIGEVLINEEITQENIDIEIVSPESGITIGENSIEISGTSQKNHNINIIVNEKNSYTTSTNNEGIFQYTIEGLINGQNTIKAEITDADSNVIGESNEIKIETNIELPRLKSLNIEKDEVEIETSFLVSAITSNITTEIDIVINDNLTSLNKDKDGEFSGYVYAPSEKGNYIINTILKDELGHKVEELGAGNIIVIEPEEEINIDDDIGLFFNDILNTAEEKKEKEEIPIETENIIEEFNVPEDLTIKGLNLVELKSKSILTWDEIEGATGYNIYKKLDDGTYEFIKNVSEAKFEIEFSGEDIKYEYFSIKAIKENTKEGIIYEGDLSEATKIQTGPEILILFIISMLIGSFVLITKNRKA